MNKSSKVCFVLGPFRSGTSMVSRLLECLGYWAGPSHELFEPSEWNPGGYVQRPDVTEFNTWLINKAGGTVRTPSHPATISHSISRVDFARLDLSWADGRNNIIVKDPRFCFTLAGWVSHSPFARAQIQVVRIRRGINHAADSALSHYDVKYYCDLNRHTAVKVLSSYDRAAAWQCSKLGDAVITLKYEDFLSNPKPSVAHLARFVGCVDHGLIANALRSLDYGRSTVNK